MSKKKKKTKRKSRTGRPSTIQTIERDEDNPEQVEVKEFLVRFNVKFVIATMILVVVCGTGMHFFHDFQLNRKVDYYLDFATKAEEEQDWKAAKRYLRNYCSLRPDDIDQFERLNLLYLDHPGNPREIRTAFFNLSKVLRKAPDKHRTRFRTAKLGIHPVFRQYSNSIMHFEYLQKHLSDLPEDIAEKEILVYKGAAYFQLLAGSKAIENYKQALDLDSSYLEAYLGLIYLLLNEDVKFDDLKSDLASIDPLKQEQTDKIEVADRLVDKLVELGQPNDEALLSRVRYSLLHRPTETFEKVIPSPTTTALQSVARIMATFDVNEDNILDGVDVDDVDKKNPGQPWINSSRIPYSADFNRDGTLTHEELKKWYEEGERISRLKIALQDLETILEDDAKNRTALRYATQLEISLVGEYLSLGNEKEAKEYVVNGNEHASKSQMLSPPDLSAFHSLSSLIYFERIFEPENSQKHFDRSIEYLREGIRTAANIPRSSESKDKRVEDDRNTKVSTNRDDLLTDEQIQELERRLHWRLADRLFSTLVYYKEKDFDSISEDVQKEIDWIEKHDKNDSILDFLRGQVFMQKRQWRLALAQFANLSEKDAKVNGLRRRHVFYLATCFERLGNPDESHRLLTQQLENDPGWVAGRRMLASSLNNSDRYEEAIEHYLPIASIPGIPLAIAKAWFHVLLRLPTEERDWNLVSEALDAEDKLHENITDDERSEILLVRVASLKARAKETQKKDKDGTTTGAISTELYTQALELLKKGITDAPSHVGLRYALIAFYLEYPEKSTQECLKLARSSLDESRKTCGEAIELVRAEARILTFENLPDAPAKLVELVEAEKMQAIPLQDRIQLTNSILQEISLMDRQENTEKIDEAHWKLLSHLVNLNPDSMSPHMKLLYFSLQKNDDELYVRHLAELKRIEGPEGPNSLFAEAYRETSAILEKSDKSQSENRKLTEPDREKLSTIKEKFRKITRMRNRWSEPYRLIGNIDYALGNRVSAIDSFELAFKRGSTDESMVSLLVRLLMDESRLEEAYSKIREYADRLKNLTSPEINRLEWQVAWNSKMTTEALEISRKNAQQNNSYHDKLLQAQMEAFTQTDRREVEILFKDAIELALDQAPTDAHGSYFAFVLYLKGIKSVEFARQQIELAEKNLPPEPQWKKQLILAKCNELIEEFDKAETQYLQALKVSQQKSNLLYETIGFYSRRNDYDNAKKYADDLIQLDADDAMKRWAKARLAVLKSNSPSNKNILEAQKELELNFNEEEKQMPGFLRSMAKILSRKISKAGRLEQIANFEKLKKVGSFSPSESFRLCLLYDLVGEDEKYEKNIKLLLESNFSKPTYNAQHARWLTVKKRFDEARTQLLKLETLMPNTLASVGTRIRFHFVKGEKELGIRAARDFLEKFQKKQNKFEFKGSLDAEQLEQSVAELEKNPAMKDRASRKQLEIIKSLIEDRRTEAATTRLKELVQQKQLQTWAANLTVRLLVSQMRNFGEIAEARSLLETFYDFNRDPEGRILAARLLADDGRIADALRMATAAEKTSRLETMAGFYAAMIHETLSKEQFETIENWLKTAYGKQPESIDILSALAEIHVFKGDFAQAVSLYRKLLKLRSTHIGALNNLAWILSQNPRTATEANILISEAIEQAGPLSELLDTRGMVQLALDNPQKAIRDFQQAISEFPSAQYYYHLSTAYYSMNDLDKARKNLKIAHDRGFSPNSLMPVELNVYQKMQSRLSKQ